MLIASIIVGLYLATLTLVHAPHNTPNCIYTHTNNQQALKSGHLSNELDTLV